MYASCLETKRTWTKQYSYIQLDNVMACCSHLPWRLFKYVCSTALLLFLFWYSTFFIIKNVCFFHYSSPSPMNRIWRNPHSLNWFRKNDNEWHIRCTAVDVIYWVAARAVGAYYIYITKRNFKLCFFRFPYSFPRRQLDCETILF